VLFLCIANALNSECEDQIRQYKRKASVTNGNENKPDKALNSEVTIPDNCKLTTGKIRKITLPMLSWSFLFLTAVDCCF
jgi:hypothetical protein